MPRTRPPGSPAPAPHPLAPLTAAEITAAAAAVPVGARISAIPPGSSTSRSMSPPRRTSSASESGGTVPDRLVKVVFAGTGRARHHEAVVRLPKGEVVSYQRIPGVQPSVMLEEFLASEDIVRSDPRWRDAMRKRGHRLQPVHDRPVVHPERRARGRSRRRPLRHPAHRVRDDPADNGYAHPSSWSSRSTWTR